MTSATNAAAERDDLDPCVEKRTSAAKAVVRRPFMARLNRAPQRLKAAFIIIELSHLGGEG
jgi:hypothetical protein